MRDVVMESDGTVIDKTMEVISGIKIHKINEKFLDINNKFLSFLYGPSLYFNNELYMHLDKELYNKDNIPLAGFDNKDDVLRYLKTHKIIIAYINGYKNVIDYKEFKMGFSFIKETANSSHILTHILDHIESYIMCVDHNEANIVNDDPLGISKHVSLCSRLALDYPLFSDFLIHQYPDMDDELVNELSGIYTVILNDIYKVLDSYNLCSVSLTFESNVIKITEFESPAARRYKINCGMLSEEGDDGRDGYDV